MKYLTLLLLACATGFAQQATRIGTVADNLSFAKMTNYSKKSAQLADFKGKVVVIDFWSVACAPCIESFPKLEELQAKFNNDLQVITVTDDTEDRIKKFLKTKKMALPIAFDADGSLAGYFPHRQIPHTIVIDKKGVVKAITSSSKVNEALINQVLQQDEIALEEKKEVMDFDPEKPLSGDGAVSYQITITPYKPGLPSMSNSVGGDAFYNRRIMAVNVSPRALYEIAYQFPPSLKTVLEVADAPKFEYSPENAWCFDLIVPQEKGAERFAIMQQQLSMMFGYRATVEKRIMPVRALRVIKGKKASLPATTGEESYSAYDGNGLMMHNAGVAGLVSFIEDMTQVPVVDQTGLTGKYDLEFAWYHEDTGKVHDELKKLGLELVDTTAEVDVLVIRDK